MKVLITGGGTIEPIDNVRSITNTGTGRLGSLIADEFLKDERVSELFYVCTKSAVTPSDKRANIINIKSVFDLEKCVADLLDTEQIDIIIHSMAVSDYTVRSVVDIGDIAAAVDDLLKKGGELPADTQRYLLDKIDESNLAGGGKISSKLKNPMILLDKTPKVLPQLREHSPNSVIVGFKLLSEVSKEELFDVAYNLLKSNGCDFVLANDESCIDESRHEGHLMDEDKNITSFGTKQEIAAGIVRATMERVK